MARMRNHSSMGKLIEMRRKADDRAAALGSMEAVEEAGVVLRQRQKALQATVQRQILQRQ